METQVMEAKGELLIEYKGKANTATIREITPQGARIDYNLQGEATGRWNASHMDTVNLLLKADGSTEGEFRSVSQTDEGDLVFIMGRGKSWPVDRTTNKFTSEVTFQTPSPRLEWLNTTKGLFEGSFIFSKGEVNGKIYAKK